MTRRLSSACIALLFLLTVSRPLGAEPVSPEPCGSADTNTSGVDMRFGLDDLARMAASRHSSVTARRAGVDASREDWNAARQQYYPSPSVQGTPGAGGGLVTVLSLQQPIWNAGRTRASVDAAFARSQSARESVLEAQQSLGLAVANAYQAVAQARGRADALQRLIGRLEGYREGMHRRVINGISAQAELDLLHARFAMASGHHKAVCHAERIARSQLSSLIDQPLSFQAVVVVGGAPDLPNLEDLLASVETRSPLLRRLEHDVAAARADADLKAAARWPTLSLVAQKVLPHGVPNTKKSTSIGLQLQYAPGAGLAAGAITRSAVTQVEILRADREAVKADLVSRVRTEYEELLSAVTRQEDALLNAQATAQVLASYERLFAAGKRSWLDVMNAARELSDAELAVADLKAQITGSRYRLDLHATQLAWMHVRQ